MNITNFYYCVCEQKRSTTVKSKPKTISHPRRRPPRRLKINSLKTLSRSGPCLAKFSQLIAVHPRCKRKRRLVFSIRHQQHPWPPAQIMRWVEVIAAGWWGLQAGGHEMNTIASSRLSSTTARSGSGYSNMLGPDQAHKPAVTPKNSSLSSRKRTSPWRHSWRRLIWLTWGLWSRTTLTTVMKSLQLLR